MPGTRFRVLTMVAAAGAVAALVPLGASASAAASGPGPLVTLQADAPPRVPHGATSLGALGGQSVLHLDVTLRIPDRAALSAYIAGLADKRSPLFHRFLSPGQFAVRFGPTLAQVASVESALEAEGLTPGRVSPDRLAISVTAPAATAAKAFGTSLVRYRLSGGRIAYTSTSAPGVPASAAPYVQGVLGLTNLYLPHSQLARPAGPAGRQGQPATRARLTPAATGPQPCAAATSAAEAAGSYTADQLASYYAMPPLYKSGDLGQGVRIALAEFEPNDPADIAAYASCYGLSTKVSYTQVDGGAGTGAGSGEAALDIENVMGLAPDAAIDVYQEPNGGDTDTYDLYSAIVNGDDKVASTSWGLCELDSDSSLIQSEHTLFAQAASQGQTVLAAAGDDGSTDCAQDGTVNAGSLAVDDPASQPYVIGVGGTSIGATSENTWNDSGVSDGAGGGGASAAWCMPSYQDQSAIPGLISSNSVTDPTDCGSTDPYVRQVPDVAADADPETGYVIYLAGSWQGGWGGTSAAAPLWAAVAALTDASPFCSAYGSGAAGVQAGGLYSMVAADQAYVYGATEGLYDVTSGDNDYTPSGYIGGQYPAGSGYDMATGLGTPLVTGFTGTGAASMFYPGIAALMCRTYATKLKTTTVTKVSPARGPSGRATTVTVTGTGFLPISGADMAYVGSRQIAASCTSTTRCTVRLPATKASTVSIQISAEDFTSSKSTAASHYQFVAAPTVKSLSPARGTHRGGTRITIRGTNFIGVTAVHFGSKRGTKIRVVSSREIIVTAPSGSGTVKVTITAAGGTSKVVSAAHYKYT